MQDPADTATSTAAGAKGPFRLAVIIPALNEERSLPLVLTALAGIELGIDRHGRQIRIAEVVVVDNGSTDGTARVASHHGATVLSEKKRGYGRACLKGLAHLTSTPPDIVVFLDADFSDDPSCLAALVGPIAAGEMDLVLGSRLLGRCEPGALLPQARYGNRLAVTLIRLLYGFTYTDLGPFRAIGFSALERLGMRDETFGWTAEMQVKALRCGLRVAEIPVAYRKRVGTSKITGTFSGTVKAGAMILWTIARYRFWNPRGAPQRRTSRDRGPS